jgi:hypothetical protein
VVEESSAAGESGDQPASTLTRWLLTRGYTVQADEYWPESFGNRLVTLVRGEVRIELNKDRGEWLIDVGSSLTPKAGLYEPTLWLSVLGKLVATEAQPAFADEATALQAVLPAIEVALRTGWSNWQALLQARSERLAQLLVKSPPEEALLDSALLSPSTGHPDMQRAAMARVARAQREKRRQPQG